MFTNHPHYDRAEHDKSQKNKCKFSPYDRHAANFRLSNRNKKFDFGHH
jgi:hypothetical protein